MERTVSTTAAANSVESRAAVRGSAHTESSFHSHNLPRHPQHVVKYNPDEGLSGQDLHPPPLPPNRFSAKDFSDTCEGGGLRPHGLRRIIALSGW